MEGSTGRIKELLAEYMGGSIAPVQEAGWYAMNDGGVCYFNEDGQAVVAAADWDEAKEIQAWMNDRTSCSSTFE